MRPIRAILLGLITAVVAFAATYVLVLRPRIKSWGVDPVETDAGLPGDDLIADPIATETRGLTIDAPVSQVWPWLAQLGDGRGGWYSFESRSGKMTSARTILPEFQTIAVGDALTVADGGPAFEVKSVDPEHSLVLYTDSAMMRPTTDASTEATTESGSSKGRQMPDFKATWGFYLQPTDDGGTRLVERFRVKADTTKMPPTAVMQELMSTGIALMARKQMLGIKERAEQPRATNGGTDYSEDEQAAIDNGEKPTGAHEPQIEIPSLN